MLGHGATLGDGGRGSCSWWWRMMRRCLHTGTGPWSTCGPSKLCSGKYFSLTASFRYGGKEQMGGLSLEHQMFTVTGGFNVKNISGEVR